MDIPTPALIGIGLSMDCFAVSLCIGTTTKVRLLYAGVLVALCFGLSQTGMTIIGGIAGSSVIGLTQGYGPWIAFLLLAVVGVKMIRDGFRDDDENNCVEDIRFIPLILLSIATSIDALAVGVTFGVLGADLLIPALIIGLVAFLLSFAGVLAGEQLEKILGNRIEIAGGIILILIGIRILVGLLPG
ncbi:MAG: manganese efflux pump MntP family protein [Methanoregula sp.]|nr:manganese efflux pump MntP family protein [Methanoregula sp.]